MIFVLYTSARPPVKIERQIGDVYVVTPGRSLQYPAAEYVREKILRDCKEEATSVVVDCRNVRSVDVTVAKV